MPFVELIWKPDRFREDGLPELCAAVQTIVAECLWFYDEEHPVTAAMVDLRVSVVGEYDRIGPDLYVTIFARSEPQRVANKVRIITDVTERVFELGVPADTLAELVLTDRTSIYDYGPGRSH